MGRRQTGKKRSGDVVRKKELDLSSRKRKGAKKSKEKEPCAWKKGYTRKPAWHPDKGRSAAIRKGADHGRRKGEKSVAEPQEAKEGEENPLTKKKTAVKKERKPELCGPHLAKEPTSFGFKKERES